MRSTKTKFIATYGPRVDSDALATRLIKRADILRINTSHGDADQWLGFIDRIRRCSGKADKEIALLADLPGPKIRVGRLEHEVTVASGDSIVLAYSSRQDAGEIPLAQDIFPHVSEGANVYIGDYGPRLRIEKLSAEKVICKVLNDGSIRSGSGVSIRGLSGSIAPPTKEDLERARFALKNDFDFVALSFVTSESDIARFRRAVGDVRVVAKIERKSAIDNIAAITEAADALMVARGDLAFDVDVEMIPMLQRKIIKASRLAKKPVIVATQMLASMVSNPSPTRAEVNDIANAVMSGADCLMLSDETAIGKYPIEAMDVLANTARFAEEAIERDVHYKTTTAAEGMAAAAADISDNYKTEAIFTPTQSGATPKLLSAHRPNAVIIAMSADPRVRRNLSLYYGVESTGIRPYKTADQMYRIVGDTATGMGIGRYMVLSGTPNAKGTTNTLYVSIAD